MSDAFGQRCKVHLEFGDVALRLPSQLLEVGPHFPKVEFDLSDGVADVSHIGLEGGDCASIKESNVLPPPGGWKVGDC